jgi:hypothetical protein
MSTPWQDEKVGATFWLNPSRKGSIAWSTQVFRTGEWTSGCWLPTAGVLDLQPADAPVAQPAGLVMGNPDTGVAHRTEQHRGDIVPAATDRVAAGADNRFTVHRRPD